MHKFDLVIDPKEEAARLRRKRNEEERKKRIFDPRLRQIGVDVDGLNKQIKEKQQIESREKLRDEAFDLDRLRNDEVAVLLNQRYETDKRELHKRIDKFRQVEQKPELRREFDLYDPEAFKKELPARVSDDDPRCSISGMQKFMGEDLGYERRKALQKEQLRYWLSEQSQFREHFEENEKRNDEIYKQKLMELDKRACDLHEAEMACRKAVELAIQNFNKSYAKQQERQRCTERKEETEDNFIEMSNTVFGDLMMEKPPQRSMLGPNRISRLTYKGMTEEEKAEIRKIQKKQAEEKKEMEEREKLEQQTWDKFTTAAAELGLKQEMESARKRRQELKGILYENKNLAQQQKAMMEYLDKEVYKNAPSDTFFDQFNTSTR